jgi:hypothetical protein
VDRVSWRSLSVLSFVSKERELCFLQTVRRDSMKEGVSDSLIKEIDRPVILPPTVTIWIAPNDGSQTLVNGRTVTFCEPTPHWKGILK